MPEPLWTPNPATVRNTHLEAFRVHIAETRGLDLPNYDALYEWSITDIEAFWLEIWETSGLIASRTADVVLGDRGMPGAEWFVGARLNFAENLLRYDDDRRALLQVSESQDEPSVVSYGELRNLVARFRKFLVSRGVQRGDRVAGFLPNRMEAVVAMLATTSLGAIWSSCSPDFGFKGVIDRFGQITPKVLVATDGYVYNTRAFSTVDRVAQVVNAIGCIETVVMVNTLEPDRRMSPTPGLHTWAQALEHDGPLAFEQVPFDHPLYIMYSSGTTGVPKCITHGHGGTLIQHAKELLLHTDLHRDDTLFYFTTCGWMMWNWLVSGLLTGCGVVLYDGSPGTPDMNRLWRMADDLNITVFGTSPKFLTMCDKKGVHPGKDFDLSELRTVLSTGAPLSVDNFAWVKEEVGTVQLASIAGGTDIISCFMLGVPTEPVWSGEIQKRGLGMAVQAFSPEGQPVQSGKGELVCTQPFPSMPVGFWGDTDGSRYHDAYFNVFPGVWRHGDWVEITEHGGVIIYGRSDTTLNPGGVRIGTAEIYRPIESMDEVAEALVVGQRWDNDVRVLLFVVLQPGISLTPELEKAMRSRVKAQASPRHIPAKILACPAIPRTISGKKVEIAVTRAVHGESIHNRDAMKNPEALDWFQALVFS